MLCEDIPETSTLLTSPSLSPGNADCGNCTQDDHGDCQEEKNTSKKMVVHLGGGARSPFILPCLSPILPARGGGGGGRSPGPRTSFPCWAPILSSGSGSESHHSFLLLLLTPSPSGPSPCLTSWHVTFFQSETKDRK